MKKFTEKLANQINYYYDDYNHTYGTLITEASSQKILEIIFARALTHHNQITATVT